MKKFSDYMNINEASEFLGVPKHQLAYWDRSGKLKPYRHPINNQRLYEREILQKLLEAIQNRGKI